MTMDLDWCVPVVAVGALLGGIIAIAERILRYQAKRLEAANIEARDAHNALAAAKDAELERERVRSDALQARLVSGR